MLRSTREFAEKWNITIPRVAAMGWHLVSFFPLIIIGILALSFGAEGMRLIQFMLFSASTISLEICLHGLHALQSKLHADERKKDRLIAIMDANPAMRDRPVGFAFKAEYAATKEAAQKRFTHRVLYIFATLGTAGLWIFVAGREVVHLSPNLHHTPGIKLWGVELLDIGGMACALCTIAFAVGKMWVISAAEESACRICELRGQSHHVPLEMEFPRPIESTSVTTGRV